MFGKVSRLMLLSVPLAISSQVYAQGDSGFFVGGFQVVPVLGISIQEDDNVFQEEHDAQSDRLTVYSPSVSAVYDNGISGVSLSYSETIGRYKEETSEDFERKDAGVALGWAMTDSQRFDLSGTWGQSQDDRSDTNDLASAEVDEYEETGYLFSYLIGSSAAPFTILLSQARDETEYTNNEAETRFNNFQEDTSALRLTWRTSPDLSFFISGSFSKIDYAIDNNDGSLPQATSDSEETGYRIGADWNVSSNTAMSLSLGENDRNYENAATGDTNNSAWNASLRWSPLYYSTFNLSALKDQNESNNDSGSLIDTTRYSIEWQNQWNERFSSELTYAETNSQYIDSAREDDMTTLRLSVSYMLNQWASLSVFNEETEMESRLAPYDRTLYGLQLTLSP